MTSETLRDIARDVGTHVWVHARRLGGPEAEVTLDADRPVAIASLYKLPVALVWADLVARGDLDPRERITLPSRGRVAGATGVSMLLDDVDLSLRDAVRLMLAVSDNTCADAVVTRIGREIINDHLCELGLTETLLRQRSAEAQLQVQQDLGQATFADAEDLLADPDRAVETSQYDAALATASTAAEMTRALSMLWARDGAAHACVRTAMARQAWRHRIGSGFPHDDVAVHGKTGTLVRLRHEAAVVQFPEEHPVAVAVLTRSLRPERHQPRIDRAIGDLARAAVAPLRMPVD